MSFWNSQQHTPAIWLAIGNGVTAVPTESISGTVFSDANGNANLDVGETGLSGQTVYIDTNDDGKRQFTSRL